MNHRPNATLMVLAFLSVTLTVAEVQAQPATQPAVNAGGSWTWMHTNRPAARGPSATQPATRRGGIRDGRAPFPITAVFKQEGETLTGTVTGMNVYAAQEKAELKEGMVKPDGSITFKIGNSLPGGGQVERLYKGKLLNNSISGTWEFTIPADDGSPPREWEARRAGS